MMQHLVAFIFITIIIRCSMMTTHGLEQCQVQSVSIYGYYLTGHVIYTKTCASLSECVILCSYEFRCKSFNFRLMDKLCELNDADRFTHRVDYVPMEGFLYKDTTERHRKVSCHLANVRDCAIITWRAGGEWKIRRGGGGGIGENDNEREVWLDVKFNT